MDIVKTRALRGPNVWGGFTAIQVEVRCTEDELALEKMPGFEKRLRERFPKMGSLKPDAGMPAALELAALGLQAHAGCPVTFSRSIPTAESGVFHVVVEYREEAVGRLAIDLGMALCAAARENAPFNLKASLNRLQILDEGVRLGRARGTSSRRRWRGGFRFGGSRMEASCSSDGEVSSGGFRRLRWTALA